MESQIRVGMSTCKIWNNFQILQKLRKLKSSHSHFPHQRPMRTLSWNNIVSYSFVTGTEPEINLLPFSNYTQAAGLCWDVVGYTVALLQPYSSSQQPRAFEDTWVRGQSKVSYRCLPEPEGHVQCHWGVFNTVPCEGGGGGGVLTCFRIQGCADVLPTWVSFSLKILRLGSHF